MANGNFCRAKFMNFISNYPIKMVGINALFTFRLGIAQIVEKISQDLSKQSEQKNIQTKKLLLKCQASMPINTQTVN
jgi:hypothetical protein